MRVLNVRFVNGENQQKKNKKLSTEKGLDFLKKIFIIVSEKKII